MKEFDEIYNEVYKKHIQETDRERLKIIIYISCNVLLFVMIVLAVIDVILR